MAHIRPPEGGDRPSRPKSVSESHLARQVLSTGPELVADVLGGLPWYAMIPLIGPYFARRAACNIVKEEIIVANNRSELPYDKEQLKRFLAPLTIDHLVLFQELPYLENLSDFSHIMQASKGMHMGEFRKIVVANFDRISAIMRIQADEDSPLTLSETIIAFLKVHQPLSQIEEKFVSLLPTYQPAHFNPFVLEWIMIASTVDDTQLKATLKSFDEYIHMVKDTHFHWQNQTDKNYSDLELKTQELPASSHLYPFFKIFNDHVCYGAIQIGDENIRTLDPRRLLPDERQWYVTMPSTRVSNPLSLWQQNQPLGDLLDRAENNMVNLHGLHTEFYIIHPVTGESRCVRVPLPFEDRPIPVEEAQGEVKKLYKQLEAGSGNPKDNEAYLRFAKDVEYAGRAALNDFFADSYFAHAEAHLPENLRDAIAQYNIYRLDDGCLSLLPQGIKSEEFITSLSSEHLQALKRGEEVRIPDLGSINVSFQADTDHPQRRKMLTTVNGVTRTSHHDARKTDEEIKASPFFERDILLGIAHYYTEGNG